MVSPRKILCLLSLMIIVVHVILSDKILRSYCLNDKNITLWKSDQVLLGSLGFPMLSPAEESVCRAHVGR